MRGIVGATRYHATENGNVHILKKVDPLELRRYVLYWDRIGWAKLEGPSKDLFVEGDLLVTGGGNKPERIVELENDHRNYAAQGTVVTHEGRRILVESGGIVDYGSNTTVYGNVTMDEFEEQPDEDLELLRAASVFEERVIRVDPTELTPAINPKSSVLGFLGTQLNEAVVMAKATLASELNQSGKGFWSVGQFDASLVKSVNMQTADSVGIELFECLPVPSINTKMHDILEFKEKRKDELLRFRHVMDSFYDQILKAPDKIKERERAVEKIAVSLSELHKALDKSKIQKVITTVETYLALKDSSALNILLTAIAAGTAGAISLNPVIAGVAGLSANAALKILKKKTPPIDKVSRDIRDYAYLYQIQKELRGAPKRG